MKSIFSFILMAVISCGAIAQLIKAKPHTVELASGVSVDGELLVYAQPIMSEPIFQLGEESVPASDVRFFRNSHGYFANLQFADEAIDGFAMRIKKGNIDLFERIDIDVYGKPELEIFADQPVTELRKMAQGRRFEYFTTDGKHIKKANYSNLRMDLQSNAESVEYLEGFRRYQWFQKGLLIAGSSLLVGSFAAQESNHQFTPVMALGIVLGGSSYFCSAPKDDFLWMAVESYNGR